ncbi:Hypothetical protein ORPV_312 [Orpheovirus IHUMI-LCC2]|uniref:DUF5857 domain-containing protein n=1 Tax=Orpheovirus IHUMI-LCC2 TaxID=2023057 RepID=A0A2I2L3V1_9VIRU|nr:Hypothetical protein ORPV_312 [Orpheovirus IHUMI-LCC2]SNW62216.1 Hypothetical protein ORPV_312 [Orpheovirus IHUMI-LCC2]
MTFPPCPNGNQNPNFCSDNPFGVCAIGIGDFTLPCTGNDELYVVPGTLRAPRDEVLIIGANEVREEVCSNLNSNEWYYDPNDPRVNQLQNPSICVNRPVPIGPLLNYSSVPCKRRAFTGQQDLCCLRDYQCNLNILNCFDTNARQRTCSPENRNIASSTCFRSVQSYCLGEGLNLNVPEEFAEWRNRWRVICPNFVSRQLFQRCGPFLPDDYNYTNEGLSRMRTFMPRMFDRYISTGRVIGSDNPDTSDELDTLLFSVCQRHPGICSDYITDVCNSDTVNSLAGNPFLARWCGCYLPGPQYDRYTQLRINRECTPLCNRTNVVSAVNPDATPRTCGQSICLLDNVTISLNNSTVSGSVNISQVCSSCSDNEGSACQCIIQDVSIEALQSNISSINFSQVCGDFSNNVPVPPENNEDTILGIPNYIFYIAVLILVILIIIFLLIIFT